MAETQKQKLPAQVETRRQMYEILKQELIQERQSFIPSWREVGEYLLPRRPRFFTSDANKGDRRNQKIIDCTATFAVKTLRAGMMAGVTPPSRPWFKLTTPDPALAEFPRVKEWLHTVTQRLATVFTRSNIYRTFPMVYGDVAGFATSPYSIEEEFTGKVMHTQSFPIGSYMIAQDANGVVNVFFREFRMTVRQLIEKFGRKDPKTGGPDWSNFSTYVRNAWERGQREQWIDVCHVIRPNDDYDPQRLQSKFKRFTSCYYEAGTAAGQSSNYMSNSANDDKYLREAGYDYFPILCPRWETTGEDVYGTDCPGFTSIGDIKQLQQGEKIGAEAILKKVRPAMVGPTSLRSGRPTTLPGDITYVDEAPQRPGFRKAHDIELSLVELEGKQEQVRYRIDRAFYGDLLRMMMDSDRRQVTATEISEKKEEKLIGLGPVMEQLNQDALDKSIDISFMLAARQGLIPPPPEELQGVPLKVEYISFMAQAQKAIGIESVERFTNYIGSVMAYNPDIGTKIDFDRLAEVYGEMMSMAPGVVRSEEVAATLRQQQAQQAQAAQTMEAIKSGAGAARDLSSANLEGDSALTRLIDQGRAGALTQ